MKTTKYRYRESQLTTQKEVTYLLFSMISDLFHSSCCRSDKLKESLFLYSREMNDKNKAKYKERILDAFEKDLGTYRGVISQMKCESFIVKSDEKYIIYFSTGFEEIGAVVYPDCRFFMKVFAA